MQVSKKSSALFKALYLLIAGLCLICIVIAIINPKKSTLLYPYPGVAAHIFADSVEPNGTSVALWLDRSSTFYECKIGYGIQHPYCGIVIKYKHPRSKNYNMLDHFEFGDAKAIDLSAYDGLYIDLEYTGQSELLIFYLRNARALPGDLTEYDQVPYLQVAFDPRQENAFIDFSQVEVAQWWIDRYDPSTHLRRPGFSHVFEMGINLPPSPAEGSHRFKIKEITAIKPIFSEKQLLLSIAVLAGIGFLMPIAHSVLKRFPQNSKNKSVHEDQASGPSSWIDPLTKGLNRMGIENAVREAFPFGRSNVYVMFLDLDRFEHINDIFGRAAGDDVLRQTVTTISKELRSNDIFGRWGGEEFVIVSGINPDNLGNLIARLMGAVQSISILGAPKEFKVSISIGVTEARAGDSFEAVLERAVDAMQQAKQSDSGNWKQI